MIGSLNEQEEQLVRQFVRTIERQFADHDPEVKLFGSYARGDHHSESDIDLLVTIRDFDWRVADAIRDAGYSIDDPIDYRFSIIVVSKDHYDAMQRGGYQFVENVESDAVNV